MNVLLVSTYELGRQPFGVASPAAWLRREGCRVSCVDLAVERLREAAVVAADLIAFYLPMHTATRLATRAVGKVRAINPRAHLCFYGLYAPGNADYLRKLGGQTILGGEFEEGLLALVRRLSSKGDGGSSPQGDDQQEPVISLSRQQFLSPDRSGLPGSATTPICTWGKASSGRWGTPRPPGDASTSVATVRSCRSTKAGSASFSARSCSPTCASRSRQGRVTSPSETLTSSTVRSTPWPWRRISTASSWTSLEQALLEAGAVRFRSIALTAAAVIAGGAVMVLDPIFQGLAVALMTGVFASTAADPRRDPGPLPHRDAADGRPRPRTLDPDRWLRGLDSNQHDRINSAAGCRYLTPQ